MNIEEKAATIFGLNEKTWLQHANPWSVYSRTLVYPFLIISIWSRVWIGWYCIIPIIFSLIYMWLNPRLFSKPKSTDNWASKAVFGEQVLMKKDQYRIPAHHRNMAKILNSINVANTIVMAIGLYHLNIYLTVFGFLLVNAMKYWYLDRMNWLFAETSNQYQELRNWIY